MNEQSTTEPAVHGIKVCFLEQLQDKVAHLNKRAAKLGLESAIELTVGRVYWEPVPGDNRRQREMVQVTLAGKAPVLNGWRIAAVLEPVGDVNLVHAMGEVPEHYRSAAMNCDHCHTARGRLKTVVLFSESEGYRQVGTQCLADYTRCEDASAALAIFRMTLEIESLLDGEDWEEGDGSLSRRADGYTLEHYLAVAARFIRKEGWVPRSAERLPLRAATANLADMALDDCCKSGEKVPADEEDFVTARAAVEWAANLQPRSDYEHNVRAICRENFVRTRHLGIAASAVASYLRAEAKKIESVAARNAGHFGEVGKRYTLSLTLTRRHLFETTYGWSTLLVFVDAEGHRFVWKASGCKDADIGSTYTVTGTVKEHGEYRDELQTTLTRCKMLDLAVAT